MEMESKGNRRIGNAENTRGSGKIFSAEAEEKKLKRQKE